MISTELFSQRDALVFQVQEVRAMEEQNPSTDYVITRLAF